MRWFKTASIADEVVAEGWGRERAEEVAEIARGRALVPWVHSMLTVFLPKELREYRAEFDRRKADPLTGERDLQRVTHIDIRNWLDDEGRLEELRSAWKEIPLGEGSFTVLQADTPEALSFLSSRPELGKNSYCVKGTGWAETYMKEDSAFLILRNGQHFAAKVNGEFKSFTDWPITMGSGGFFDLDQTLEPEEIIDFAKTIENVAGVTKGWPDHHNYDAVREVLLDDKIRNEDWKGVKAVLRDFVPPDGMRLGSFFFSENATHKLNNLVPNTPGIVTPIRDIMAERVVESMNRVTKTTEDWVEYFSDALEDYPELQKLLSEVVPVVARGRAKETVMAWIRQSCKFAAASGTEWEEVLNRFPEQLQKEIIDERPHGSQSDIEEINPWRLVSQSPIDIQMSELLKIPDNQSSIARSPQNVVQKINEKWGLDIGSGTVYDQDPDRYERYSNMDAKTADPSIMVNGEIYWGVGRFIAALLRGDDHIKVWDIRT
jgi:hypothetical protein